MKKILRTTSLSLAFICSAQVQSVSAQSVAEAADAITQGWSGSATLGASSASGNADSSSISGSIRLGKTVGRWEHLVFGAVFQGESSVVRDKLDENDVDNDEDFTETLASATGEPQEKEIITGDKSDRITLGYQPKFYWRPRTYFFGLLDWEKDKPGNIDTSTRQIIGIGHKFYNNDTGFFSGEIGFGNKNLEKVSGGEINGGVGYLGLNFLHRFNDSASFNADLKSDFGSDSTFVEIGLGLAFVVSDGISLKIGHFTRNNSDLGDPNNLSSKSSDSVTTMNLVFDI